MKIVIVGAGASGIYLSLLLKRTYPSEDINVYEASDKVLTKVKASGNGRCNINNKIDDINAYNHPSFVKPLFEKYPYEVQEKELLSLNIATKELNDNLLYPLSESGHNVKTILLNEANKLGVKIHLNKVFTSYEIKGGRISVTFNENETFICDRLVFACGTHASFKNSKSSLVFNELKRHGYDIVPLQAGLTPIYVKEDVRRMQGERVKGIFTSKDGAFNMHQEVGEVLFKRDGLSGIAMFNISSFLARNNIKTADISFSLMHDKVKLFNDICKQSEDPLISFFPKEVAGYIYSLVDDKKDVKKIGQALLELSFTYNGNYSADNAQVCIGGVNINNINNLTLESNIEKHVFFMGEMIDIDGYCGGFNLKWALVSALAVKDNIK